MNRKHYDKAIVKREASGRWGEIIPALAGIPVDILDGKHHPCPACDGIDRFRALDDFAETGAVLCNQCLSDKNGDGFAAIMHYTGCDFPTALSKVANYLEVKPSQNGKAKSRKLSKKNNPLEQVRWAKGDNSNYRVLILTWCRLKPPITLDAAETFDARYCWWPNRTANNYRCVAFTGRDTKGKVKAVLLYRVEDTDFPKVGKLQRRKTHLAAGSVEAWLYAGSPDTLPAAEVIVKCEGPPDALALTSIGLPDGWIAITNACGARSANPKNLDFSFAKGKKVVIAGDADKPGQEGGQRFAVSFVDAGASDVRVVQLPYDVAEDHGKDLRDWLNEGHTTKDFAKLVEETEPVTNEQLKEWRATKSAIRHLIITNATTESDEDGNPITVPMPMGKVLDRFFNVTNGLPHKCSGSLFVPRGDGQIDHLIKPSQLFGWAAGVSGFPVQWHRTISCVTKEECFAEIQRTAEEFGSIEILPHEPPIDGVYYACHAPSPGDGKTLKQLLDQFSPATDHDRQLLMAAFMTPMWGGPPGARPAFLFTCLQGRGKGKSVGAQTIGKVYGGTFDVSTNEDIGDLKARLLSPDAAIKRVALLDNVKTTRFSWAELESLITSNAINGKRLYVGDASRPNYFTWLVTLNGASLSTDMAQRTVEIQLSPPTYRKDWDKEVAQFIDSHRQAILADVVGMLRQPRKEVTQLTRWATWESDVVARLDAPDELVDLILERRSQSDVEEEEGGLIEDSFDGRLRALDYDPDRDDIFLGSTLVAKWFNAATGERYRVTGVSRRIKQLINEGRLHRLQEAKHPESRKRGWRWVGEHADVDDRTKLDINHRMRQARKEGEDREF